MQRTIFVLIALLGTSSLMADDVYRWIDEKGSVHYTDRKPKQFSKRVKTIKAPTTELAQTADEGKEQTRLTRCAEYQQRFSDYEGAQSLSRKNADGSERLLTETERTQLLEDTRKQIDAFCEE